MRPKCLCATAEEPESGGIVGDEIPNAGVKHGGAKIVRTSVRMVFGEMSSRETGIWNLILLRAVDRNILSNKRPRNLPCVSLPCTVGMKQIVQSGCQLST